METVEGKIRKIKNNGLFCINFRLQNKEIVK